MKKELALCQDVWTVLLGVRFAEDLQAQSRQKLREDIERIFRLLPERYQGPLKRSRANLIMLHERAEKHERLLKPLGFRSMIFIIAWLAGFGIVLPLGFLYGGPDPSAKGWLLLAFGLGVIGLLAYFTSILKDVEGAGKLILHDTDKIIEIEK